MNIVKVKSIRDNNGDVITFSGRYCWCVSWKHIVDLDDYTISEIISLEQNGQTPSKQGTQCVSYATYQTNGYIDNTATDAANSIAKWVEYNKFSPDDDITVDEVKQFRTWLARTLYNLDKDTASYEVREMLAYYMNEMNDATVQHLSTFAKTTVKTVLQTGTSSCSCNKTSESLISASLCDAVEQYRTGVRNIMISTFSDISFWSGREQDLQNEIAHYIDNIIKMALPLTQSPYASQLYDCGCLTNANTPQQTMTLALENISKAFKLMAAGTISGNRDFISRSLNEFAVSLYEIMRW